MRNIDRFDLISKIGRELQQRMTYSDIQTYLSGFNVDTTISTSNSNSKWIYVKELLAPVDEVIILKIADELEINHNYNGINNLANNDSLFWKEGYFRLFLSHISSFKKTTSLLQKNLLPFGISGFVAHEYIVPTKEWQTEIEKALYTMDSFVAILMDGFKESNWCDQEVGAALGRNVLIIPLRRGLDPYGFLGKYQGLQTIGKNIGEVAQSIFNILINNEKTRDKMLSVLVGLVLRTDSKKDADLKIGLISNIENVPVKFIEKLKKNATENEIIKNSKELISKLNNLIRSYNLDEIILHSNNSGNDKDDLPF